MKMKTLLIAMLVMLVLIAMGSGLALRDAQSTAGQTPGGQVTGVPVRATGSVIDFSDLAGKETLTPPPGTPTGVAAPGPMPGGNDVK